MVPGADSGEWVSVANVGEALDDVVSGRSTYAMIAMENSIEGGVSATQDALAELPGLRIVGEYQVPVRFSLVAAPGTSLSDVSVLAAHRGLCPVPTLVGKKPAQPRSRALGIERQSCPRGPR